MPTRRKRRRCPDCDATFLAGPRTQRCNNCRRIRKKAQDLEAKRRFISDESDSQRLARLQNEANQKFAKRFGISRNTFLRLYELQGGNCDCCATQMVLPTSKPSTSNTARRFLPIWLREDPDRFFLAYFKPKIDLDKTKVQSKIVCLTCYKRLRRIEQLRQNQLYARYYGLWVAKYTESQRIPAEVRARRGIGKRRQARDPAGAARG